MPDNDSSFVPSEGLHRAVSLLSEPLRTAQVLPQTLPETGVGEDDTLEWMAPHVLGRAARLDRPDVLAHMNPPAPWITWAMAMWNARLNQNLLHPDTGPFAIEAEEQIIRWLIPFFGMQGGHLCAGSTLANLTALWAARDAAGVRRVVASEAAHLSIRKSATILGLDLDLIPVNEREEMDAAQLGDLSDACLVLTAGTTATGAIDDLSLIGRAAWSHVDAAWTGPLRLSRRYASLLDGIERADSVSVSAHKWFFQPKESALIFFRDIDRANAAITYESTYLTKSNVGIQGSRGASSIPLLATLLAWGRAGLEERLNHAMALSQELAVAIADDDRWVLWNRPRTGLTVFRPSHETAEEVHRRLPEGMLSLCSVGGQRWLRSVAANPLADVSGIVGQLQEALPLAARR